MSGAQQLNIPAGTTLRFGAPAQPMAAEISTQIALLVASVPAIREAHLPMCDMVGSGEAPRQVLVLAVESSGQVEQALHTIGEGLNRILPSGTYLDLWPLPQNHELLSIVRKTGCQIHPAAPIQPKPWWKFWS